MPRVNENLSNKAHKIGSLCKMYRTTHLKGVNQSMVAQEIGCSREAVSHFEQGINPNSAIFLWYIEHGLMNEYPMLLTEPVKVLGNGYES